MTHTSNTVWANTFLSVLVAITTIVVCVSIVLAEKPSDSETNQDQVNERKPNSNGQLPAKYTTLTIRGRMVWLNEAIERRYGVQTVPEAKERVIALEAKDGRLYPLVEDRRGRSFRKDPRLRDMRLELKVRQYQGSPSVQIIQVYELANGRKSIVDYWCDVCAITMYEYGPCDCCQDQNRLRRRPVDSIP